MRLIKTSTSRRLTVWGWLAVLIFCCIVVIFFMRSIYSFLSVNKPVPSPIWVIEGHVDDSVTDRVAGCFKNGDCSILFTTGIPLEKQLFCGHYLNYADLTAASLIYKGVDSSNVHSVPCNPVQTDRTCASVLALKHRLTDMGYKAGKINIVSQGTHARRTYIISKKILGKDWEVGCITYPSHTYDPDKWWRSSYGVRAVLYEGIACLYTILFSPFQQITT